MQRISLVAVYTVVEIVEGLKVHTVNVRSLNGRSREVVEMLSRRGVDICCLREMQYKGRGTTFVVANENKYKLWCSESENGANGIGIFIKCELAWSVIEVERFGDQMMKVKVVLEKIVHQINLCAIGGKI